MLAIVTMKSKVNGSTICFGVYREGGAEKVAAKFRDEPAVMAEMEPPEVVRQGEAEFLRLAALWPQGGMWIVPAQPPRGGKLGRAA